MIDKMTTGNRIAALRRELGYSQAAFAEKLNVSAQAVSKWETGLTLPDIETLLDISWICNTSINQILEGHDFSANAIPGVDRGLQLMDKLLICPECKARLKLNAGNVESMFFQCENGHNYDIIDGVVYFGSREIPGEQWSLTYKNYDEYLREQRHPGLSRYQEGPVPCIDVLWHEIEKLRPKTIIDIACGTGSAIKHIIKRITWPVTVIMADLSHRILKWNKEFYSEEWRNPYVDMVYIACDCSNIPIIDNAIDVTFSNGGFESMQAKKLAGFSEAYRILKPESHAVYNMSIVDDHESENSKKWIELYTGLPSGYAASTEKTLDISQWLDICKDTGFTHNEPTNIYGEMPAPDTDIFPFENQVL